MKTRLAEAMIARFGRRREQRAEWLAHPERVAEVRAAAAARAQATARVVLDRARSAAAEWAECSDHGSAESAGKGLFRSRRPDRRTAHDSANSTVYEIQCQVYNDRCLEIARGPCRRACMQNSLGCSPLSRPIRSSDEM